MTVLWSCAAWGADHVRLFNRFHVPSMLLPGNLDALKALGPVRMLILTRQEDWGALQPGFQLIERALGEGHVCAFMVPWHVLTEHHMRPHQIMVEMQRIAVAQAIAGKAALVWTHPDVIFPEGQYAGLGSVSDFARADVGCVLGWSPSIDASGPEWGGHHADYPILQSASTFGRDTLRPENLHPLMQLTRFDPCAGNWPSALWSATPTGIVAHGFHMNALICWPTAVDRSRWLQALDVDFTDAASFARPRIVVAKRFMAAELATADKPYLATAPALGDDGIARWAAANATEVGIRTFGEQICVNADGPDAAIAARARTISELAMRYRRLAA